MGVDIKTGRNDDLDNSLVQLLKECVNALNQIPNKKISSEKYPDTYSLASDIDKKLKKD